MEALGLEDTALQTADNVMRKLKLGVKIPLRLMSRTSAPGACGLALRVLISD